MKPDNKNLRREPTVFSSPAHFLRRLSHMISDLFKPEEVEVTFKVEGNTTRYTYTKVPEKQVA